MSTPRSRPLYASLALFVIGAGLVWRSGHLPLSSFFAKYGGDSLWALVVFLCFGFAFPRTSTIRITLAAICFAWMIEFFQLYEAAWINEVRLTVFGRYVLGSTFNSPDLVAYAVGVMLGASAEYLYRRRHPDVTLRPSS